MREPRRGGEREWGVEECEVYYTMRRKVGKVARERERESCFGLRDTSQGLTQPLLDPPTGQLSPPPPSLPSTSGIRLFLRCGDPLRAGRYFSINNNLHRERGRRYSVSVLVEPPTPTQR